MYREDNMETYIIMCKNRQLMRICCLLGEFKQGLCDRLKGDMRKEVGGKFRSEGTWVYLWLILFDV